MLKRNSKKFLITLEVTFLLVFMIGVFGPSEIFFGNYKEFGFVYGEFGWKFLAAGVLGSVVLALCLSLLPERINKWAVAILWGCAICSYAQVMFLNKGLDQIGVTAEGYIPEQMQVIKNALAWGVIIGVAVAIVYYTKEKWKRVVSVASGILLAVQIVAFGTLFLTAEKEALAYVGGGTGLDMSGQYTVSSNENIIVILLDNVANEWMIAAEQEYPDIYDSMQDFTYYNNADCNYYGTFPSLVHVLTGHPLDMSVPVNTYMKDCWSNKRTENYFALLKEHGYVLNVYTHLHEVLSGGNPLDITKGKVNNLMEKEERILVDYPKLYETMIQMSLYRYLPEYFKPKFDVKNEQYASIVSYPENQMNYSNPNFYNGLLEKGLTLDDSKNYFVVNHLNGAHEWINNEYCQYSDILTPSSALKGMFVLVEEYLKQLKEAGVYDAATIIVMSDHGTGDNAQPIFFFKGKYEAHEVMQRSTAPITYDEFVPTIVEELGEDHTVFGRSIHDIGEEEVRERIFIERALDGNFPRVKRYDGMNGGANVWHVYRYTGNLYQIQEVYDWQYEIVPMVDSYY